MATDKNNIDFEELTTKLGQASGVDPDGLVRINPKVGLVTGAGDADEVLEDDNYDASDYLGADGYQFDEDGPLTDDDVREFVSSVMSSGPVDKMVMSSDPWIDKLLRQTVRVWVASCCAGGALLVILLVAWFVVEAIELLFLGV